MNYRYRQDSDLLYLTGIDQEETILVLVPGAKTKKEIIFSSESNLTREHWNGHTLTAAEVTDASGVATVYPFQAFRPFIKALVAGAIAPQTSGLAADEFSVFHDAVKAGKARIGILERRARRRPARAAALMRPRRPRRPRRRHRPLSRRRRHRQPPRRRWPDPARRGSRNCRPKSPASSRTTRCRSCSGSAR